MSDETPTTKLGSTRLYKAIAEGNIGMVTMYIMALNETNNVQGFQYLKAWELWQQHGGDADMLGALMQYAPLRGVSNLRGRRGRRRFSSNDSFSFVARVIDDINRRINHNPSAPDLVKVKSYIRILERFNAANKIDAAALITPLLEGKDWPYAIMSESKALSHCILEERHSLNYAMTDTIIDWYLDLFGPITGDFPQVSHLLEDPEKVPLLLRLIPEKKHLKKLFNQYPYSGLITNAITGHQRYLKLKPLIPWIDEAIVKNKEGDDNDDDE